MWNPIEGSQCTPGYSQEERKGRIQLSPNLCCVKDTWDNSIMPKRPIILGTKIENGKEAKKKDCPRKGKSAFKKNIQPTRCIL